MSPLRPMPRVLSHGVSIAMLVWVLGGCASSPVPSTPAFDAVAAVAAIHAAGASDERELVIRPLGDSEGADLREQAAQLQARGQYEDAAVALDRALAINAEDPALLQERAEVALLQHDLALAEQLARRAFEAGSQVGPLCRRHWETIAQVRTIQAATALPPAATAAEARQARDDCTVAAPNRF